MKTSIISATLFLFTLMIYGQDGAINLTFTARNNTAYLQLDSIKVINRTQGGDTVLFWNDTVLSLFAVTIPEISGSRDHLQVFQNLPDPATGQTIISIRVPERDQVEMTVTDLLGRQILQGERILGAGVHSFRLITGSDGLCIFTARWKGEMNSVRVLPVASPGTRPGALEYIGTGAAAPQFKSTASAGSFLFSPGDELLYTGFANGSQSGIRDHPGASKLYTFEFATNIPCPGMSMVIYGGIVYNTLQVFSQCWFRENLNIGTLINPGQDQTDNGILEKYCLEDSEDSCSKYGAYYQWDEVMQYTLQPGVQGICPEGWHVPDDEDWKILEGAVDSQFGIGNPEWDNIGFRGYDAGANLRSTVGWYSNGNGPDPFGFRGLPAGYSFIYGYFWKTLREAYWWTSTPINNYAWTRLITYDRDEIHRLNFDKVYGFNVRCLKN